MRFTLSWLRDHLDFSLGLEALLARLTSLGLEVEEARTLVPKGFFVAKVLSVRAHPRAESLSLCLVLYDEKAPPAEVVCGAHNVREGFLGVFAPLGSVIPASQAVLREAKIQGESSRGMLLSGYELGLSSEHEEILELEGEAPVGADFAEHAHLDDWLIEVAVTPNRADCLSVRGIARDLSAAEGGRLIPLAIPKIEESFSSPIDWHIDLPDKKHCPYVVGRYFRNLKNRAAPQYVRERLRAIGTNPISALVDMTNYMTMDLGRPLHAFDSARLTGKKMSVRKARTAERLAALDNRDYELSPAMTVIADERGVQGLAGIMGGRDSGCTEHTESVFLECALFDRADIAETGRALNLHSEARFRFERGLDAGMARVSCDIASAYVLDWCGGEASALSEAGSPALPTRTLTLQVPRIESYGGVKMSKATARSILERLGFLCSKDSAASLSLIVPTWRQDVEEEACLIEEVLRVYGFDKVTAAPFVRTEALGKGILDQRQRRSALVRKRLAMCGLDEVVTWSFVDSQSCAEFPVSESLRLCNPISEQLDVMRPTLLLGLLQVAASNMARGEKTQSLFEVGPVFSAIKESSEQSERGAHGIDQSQVAAGLRVGRAHERHWAQSNRDFDLFDCKADLLSVFSVCGLEVGRLESRAAVVSGYHPSRAGLFVLGKSIIGCFGELHPDLAARFGLRGRPCAFEGFLETIPLARRRIAAKGFHKQRLQSVRRDFAFWLPEGVSAADVKTAVQRSARNNIAHVQVFDDYRDSTGTKRSLAFEVAFAPQKGRAYDDHELRLLSEKIVACVAALGGVVRDEGGS